VAADGGASGSASKTRATREMLPRARWWWTRAEVLWGDGAAELRSGAEPPWSDGAGASAPVAVQKVSEAGDNLASAAPGGACIRQGMGKEGEKVGQGVLDCLGQPRGKTPRGRGQDLFHPNLDRTRPVDAGSNGDGRQNTAMGRARRRGQGRADGAGVVRSTAARGRRGRSRVRRLGRE
jgi:hypothetical protein